MKIILVMLSFLLMPQTRADVALKYVQNIDGKHVLYNYLYKEGESYIRRACYGWLTVSSTPAEIARCPGNERKFTEAELRKEVREVFSHNLASLYSNIYGDKYFLPLSDAEAWVLERKVPTELERLVAGKVLQEVRNYVLQHGGSDEARIMIRDARTAAEYDTLKASAETKFEESFNSLLASIEDRSLLYSLDDRPFIANALISSYENNLK